jgi:hypothetical protein
VRLARSGRSLRASLQRRWRHVQRVAALLRRAARAVAVVTVLALGAASGAAVADERSAVASAQLELRADADPGLFLEAQFDFELPPTLEDAVNRGVALYFVVDFELFRERWYWFDRKVLIGQLSYRLSYSPLTRQYRLARGSLAQPFETIGEALATIRSVRSWKLAERDIVQPGSNYNAQVRLRLDTSLLPKPFQVNALTNRDWTLASDWRRVAMPAAAVDSVH